MRKEGFEIPAYALLKKCLMFVDTRMGFLFSCKMRFVVSEGPGAVEFGMAYGNWLLFISITICLLFVHVEPVLIYPVSTHHRFLLASQSVLFGRMGR